MLLPPLPRTAPTVAPATQGQSPGAVSIAGVFPGRQSSPGADDHTLLLRPRSLPPVSRLSASLLTRRVLCSLRRMHPFLRSSHFPAIHAFHSHSLLSGAGAQKADPRSCMVVHDRGPRCVPNWASAVQLGALGQSLSVRLKQGTRCTGTITTSPLDRSAPDPAASPLPPQLLKPSVIHPRLVAVVPLASFASGPLDIFHLAVLLPHASQRLLPTRLTRKGFATSPSLALHLIAPDGAHSPHGLHLAWHTSFRSYTVWSGPRVVLTSPRVRVKNNNNMWGSLMQHA